MLLRSRRAPGFVAGWWIRRSFEMYWDPEQGLSSPDVGDLTFDVVWMPCWHGQLPDVTLTLGSNETLGAVDIESRIPSSGCSVVVEFEREITRAWNAASPERRTLQGVDYESTIPERARLGDVNYMAAELRPDGRIGIPIDFGGGIVGSGDHMLAMWLRCLDQLASAHRIVRVTVGG